MVTDDDRDGEFGDGDGGVGDGHGGGPPGWAVVRVEVAMDLALYLQCPS